MDRTGLHPAGPDARFYVIDELLSQMDERTSVGSPYFGERMSANYAKFRDQLARWELQIGVATGNSEFIIGDDPVQTMNSTSGRVGIVNGVDLREADTLVLPIGPRHIMAVGNERQWIEVPSHVVRRFNGAQISTAEEKVYFRRGSSVIDEVASVRAEVLRLPESP